MLCDDYVSIIADGTSVSTFLGPEEVIVTAVQLSAQKLKYYFKVVSDDFLESETQLIILIY